MQSKSEIRIEQTLHGYDRGHRELASSIELNDRARSTMLVLSDLVATSAFDSGKSYITAYPLRDASRYVIARTWLAGAGYRPGSVWTHSLLLDYQSLVLLPDLLTLPALFKLPRPDDFKSYGRTIIHTLDASDTTFAHVSRQQAANALVQLYGECPVDDVVVHAEQNTANEVLALTLWRQMWPALRREFAFTSAPNANLSGFDFTCTLRFAYNWQAGLVSSDATDAAGYVELLDDLPRGGMTALRAFLARYAIESTKPRTSAPLLAGFFRKTLDANPLERLAAAQPLLANGKRPRMARDLITEAVSSFIDTEEVVALISVVGDTVVEIDYEAFADRLVSLARLDLRSLFDACAPATSPNFAANLLERLVCRLPLSVVAACSSDLSRLAIGRIRPEVLAVSEWWPTDDMARGKLLPKIAELSDVDWSAVLEALGPQIGQYSARALLQILNDGFEMVGVALFTQGPPHVREGVAQWIVERPTRLQLLADRAGAVTVDMLEMLAAAQVRQPSAPIHAASWFRLFSVPRETPENAGTASLVVGYVAALQLDEASSLSLARAVLGPLYRAVRRYKLGSRELRYLENALASFSRLAYGDRAINRSALTRWPVTEKDAGALRLSDDVDQIVALAREVANRDGSKSLQLASEDPDIGAEGQAGIRLVLEEQSEKKSRRRSFWNW